MTSNLLSTDLRFCVYHIFSSKYKKNITYKLFKQFISERNFQIDLVIIKFIANISLSEVPCTVQYQDTMFSPHRFAHYTERRDETTVRPLLFLVCLRDVTKASHYERLDVRLIGAARNLKVSILAPLTAPTVSDQLEIRN